MIGPLPVNSVGSAPAPPPRGTIDFILLEVCTVCASHCCNPQHHLQYMYCMHYYYYYYYYYY